MAVAGRTHRPVVNKDLCQRCSICVNGCPARIAPDFMGNPEMVRGYVYQKTDLINRIIVPPCTGACPLRQKVRDYVKLLEKGEVRDALLTIRDDNPFPSICAYVCHHPCEDACVRGSWDDPVSIRELKRYAVQYEIENRDEILAVLEKRKAPNRGKKVTVIGGGPAGLACAYALLMAGCKVEILDALDRPGGMLVGGIPSFRLPKWVIEHDVDMIRALGGFFTMSVGVGKDVTFEQIRKDSDGVVVATGAWKDLELGIPGEGSHGTERCLDFLRRVNLEGRKALSGKLVVIGGGNAAIDTARCALRVGAEEVILIYRRSQEEMPANREEIEAALYEGVQIRYLEAPKRFLVEAGSVKGLELVRMKLSKPDESGRKRPVPVERSEFVEDADWIIPAVGQRPEVEFLNERALTVQGLVSCEDSGRVSGYEDVFAAGDVVIGPSTVVEAAASGKKVAQLVLKFLGGMN